MAVQRGPCRPVARSRTPRSETPRLPGQAVSLLADTVVRLADAAHAGVLLELLAPYAALHVVESARQPATARCDVWTLAYGGQTAHLHVRGLGDLAQLVGHPGRDFHVLELVSAPRPPVAAGPAGADEPWAGWEDCSGDAVLDTQAVTAYRKRLGPRSGYRRRRPAPRHGTGHPRAVAAADRRRARRRSRSGQSAPVLHAPAERARKAVGNRIRSACGASRSTTPTSPATRGHPCAWACSAPTSQPSRRDCRRDPLRRW